MNAPESLVLDLVEWVAGKPKPIDVVLDAWRTSCPRLPVWEDAVDCGYVSRTCVDGEGVTVSVSRAGIEFLRSRGRTVAAAWKVSRHEVLPACRKTVSRLRLPTMDVFLAIMCALIDQQRASGL